MGRQSKTFNRNINWLPWLFKRLRGVSKNAGGQRELSSGFLSDAAREKIIAEATLYKGNLLEIGCGEGLFLKEIIDRKSSKGENELFGMDVKCEMIERAKSIIGADSKYVSFIQGNGEALPFEDASFDRVVCVNIFHNIPSMSLIESIIKETGRILKKNGVFIFEIRNKYNPFMYLLYRWAYIYDTSIGDLPLNTYFYHEIKNILKKHDLKVIRKKGVLIPIWFLAPVFTIVARKVN